MGNQDREAGIAVKRFEILVSFDAERFAREKSTLERVC